MRTERWIEIGGIEVQVHAGIDIKIRLDHGVLHIKNPSHKIDCGYEVWLVPSVDERYRHYTNVFEDWVLMIQKAAENPEEFKEQAQYWNTVQ